jgi:sec-independent protein translocase protein TatA
MGAFSIWHVLILGAVALLLFGGRFKISDLMGDLGKGISSFRKGLAEPHEPPRTISPDAAKDTANKDPAAHS